MEIKHISLEEVDDVMRIYDEGACQMEKDGCLTWKDGYPNIEMAEQDINNKDMYGVYDEQNNILGLFTLNSEVYDQYNLVSWITGDKPFLAIHRLAVSLKGKGKGVAAMLIDFSIDFGKRENYSSIRIDAYHKNWRALKLYEGKEFVRVGTVQFEKNEGENFCLERVI